MDDIRILRCESLNDARRFVEEMEVSERQKLTILMFMDELEMKGFSPHRIMAYAYTLAELARFSKKDFASLAASDIRQYVRFLLTSKKNRPTTVREKMMRIRVFLRWLHGLPPRSMPEPVKWFFTIRPRPTKGSKPLMISEKLISYDEYLALLGTAKNARDRALLQFMYESGARILEILRVRIRDVNISEHYAVVGGGKRIVPIANTDHIEHWLREHPLSEKPDAYLFCNLRDPKKPMSYPAVRRMLQRLSAKAGIGRKITPHMFRHSRATILAKLGVSPYAMNRVMGWSPTTKMWQIYLHLTQRDAILEVLRKLQARS
mgnify:CR=1 FL=1